MKIVVFLAGLMLAFSASAQDAIGYVKTVTGEASVTTSGTSIDLGSELQTGKSSSMGVTFKDETLMSFGENTQLTVDQYLYAPSEGKLKLNGKLAKGTLNYVSGVIAKLQPDAVSIGTPSGVIGVRGTQFLVKVAE
jgi:hypothetical protein